MFETINTYFALYTKAIATNPLLAGFALYAMSLVTYIARNVPLSLWHSFKRAIITTMTMDNSNYSAGEIHFNSFQIWFMKSRWSKWSRTIHSQGERVEGYDGNIRTPGYGKHFFFYQGRLFWFDKIRIESPGTDKEKTRITMHTFGRSQTPLFNLIDAFTYTPSKEEIAVKVFQQNYWSTLTTINKRGLDSVIVRDDIKNDLIKNMDRFVNNPDWFKQRGLPYKLTMLFKGKPGTGKTSLIKALASTYNRSICLLDLSQMNNVTLANAIAMLPSNSVLLIEDVDAATNSLNKRTGAADKSSGPIESISLMEAMGEIAGLTLAGVLNILDGVIPLRNVVVALTSNHPEKLDPALLRKSRIDLTYEIGYLETKEIHQYAKLMYPGEYIDASVYFEPTAGCDVQAAFMESEDIFGFISHLRRRHLKSA